MNKAKSIFIFSTLLLLLCSYQAKENKLLVYIDNYKTEVTEGLFINCRKISDLSVIMPITEEMKSYDMVKLELHRFGDTVDIIAASRIFEPKSKSFLKKEATKPSMKYMILEKEGQFTGSDLETNTKYFPANSTTNSIFCTSHDIKQCSFYLIVKGYNKTGEKTQFDEDVYDKGKPLTPKSVVFKSWIDRTVR